MLSLWIPPQPSSTQLNSTQLSTFDSIQALKREETQPLKFHLVILLGFSQVNLYQLVHLGPGWMAPNPNESRY